MTDAGGGLEITYNDALTDIDGLASLTQVGGFLDIHTNATLTNLDGLASLTELGDDLDIYTNPALCQSFVDAFVAMMEGHGWSGSATSYDNDDTC